MKKYLVCYASKTGTTREVAERIQAGLRGRSITVDLSPVDQAGDLSGYAGFIVGSPVNGMRPLPAFTEFLTVNQLALAKKVAGVFILSYIYQLGRPIWKKRVDAEIDRIRADFGPDKIAIFGARMAGNLPGMAKWLFGIPKNAPADNRNWAEIDAWTDRLAKTLKE